MLGRRPAASRSLGSTPSAEADVDQRLQRVLHDRLGQAARRVVRAACCGGRCPAVTKTLPGGMTTGLADIVVAHQTARTARRRAYSRIVAAAGGLQAAADGSPRLECRSAQLQRRLRPAGSLLQELDQLRLALGSLGLQLRRAAFPAPRPSLPRRPSTGSRGAHGGVVEQALVDVADLFDVERPEAQAPRLGCRRPAAFTCSTCSASSRCSTVRLLTGSGWARRVAPARAGRAAFEEREAVGVEQAPP